MEDSQRHESLFLVNEALGFVIDGQTDDGYMLAGTLQTSNPGG